MRAMFGTAGRGTVAVGDLLCELNSGPGLFSVHHMRVVVRGQKTTGLPRYFDFLMVAFLGLGVVAFWNVLTDLSEGRPAPFWIPGDTRTSCTMTLPSVMRCTGPFSVRSGSMPRG